MSKLVKIGVVLWMSFTQLYLKSLVATDTSESTPDVILAHKENTFFGKIRSISQVTEYTTNIMERYHLKSEDVLLVCDWDNTVSAINGSSLPLREDKRTREVLSNLLDLKIPTIILTSRLAGAPVVVQGQSSWEVNRSTFTTMISCANNMLTGLNLSMPDIFSQTASNFTLPTNNLKFGQYSYPEPFAQFFMVIYKNIVFAGTPEKSVKGPALTLLLDHNLLKQKPQLIIFVENNLDHIESVLSSFKNRPEQVMTLYYPQEPVELNDLQHSILTP